MKMDKENKRLQTLLEKMGKKIHLKKYMQNKLNLQKNKNKFKIFSAKLLSKARDTHSMKIINLLNINQRIQEEAKISIRGRPEDTQQL